MYVNEKLMSVETVPGMEEGGIRDNGRGGDLKYDIFDTL
jgi:hypothetical protein